ncbi:hypothetical protein H4N59_10555 [Corynebacterium diphtheriae bv. mitis]|nr:hypothetical protein [Corynebacterium diphtheriae bv. mitis]
MHRWMVASSFVQSVVDAPQVRFVQRHLVVSLVVVPFFFTEKHHYGCMAQWWHETRY